MCDYVDYPPQNSGHGFAVLCSISAVSRISVDSCDFFTHIFFCVASLVVWGIQSKGYFRHFHHKYVTKNILIFVSFSCGLIQTHK